MTIASFDLLQEQLINLIYAQGMHYKAIADAIKNDGSIELGIRCDGRTHARAIRPSEYIWIR